MKFSRSHLKNVFIRKFGLLFIIFSCCFITTASSSQDQNFDAHTWSIEAVEKVLTLSHQTNLETHLESLSPYFTPDGFRKFKDALKRSRLYEAHQEKGISLKAVFDKERTIPDPVQNSERELVVYVPVIVTNAAPSYQGPYLVKLIFSKDNNPLLIDQFLMGAEYRTQECEKYLETSHSIMQKRLEEMNFVQRKLFLMQAENNKNKVLDLLSESEKKLILNSPCE